MTAYSLTTSQLTGAAIRAQLRVGQRVVILVGGHAGGTARIVSAHTDPHDGKPVFTVYTHQLRTLGGYRAEQLQAVTA